MTRLTAVMVGAAALWLLAPVAAGLADAPAATIALLVPAMFAVQVAGKPHLLRPPSAELVPLALGALFFAALGWAAGGGLAALLGPVPALAAAPWIMLPLAGLSSWWLRGLSDPRIEAMLDETTEELERIAREVRDAEDTRPPGG